MKRHLAWFLVLGIAFAAPAFARTSISVNFGWGPPPLVVVPGTPVYYVDEDDFPYDCFYYGGYYYLWDDGFWYRAHSYRGPFVGIDVDFVPQPIFGVPRGYWHHPVYGAGFYGRGWGDRGWAGRGDRDWRGARYAPAWGGRGEWRRAPVARNWGDRDRGWAERGGRGAPARGWGDRGDRGWQGRGGGERGGWNGGGRGQGGGRGGEGRGGEGRGGHGGGWGRGR